MFQSLFIFSFSRRFFNLNHPFFFFFMISVLHESFLYFLLLVGSLTWHGFGFAQLFVYLRPRLVNKFKLYFFISVFVFFWKFFYLFWKVNKNYYWNLKFPTQTHSPNRLLIWWIIIEGTWKGISLKKYMSQIKLHIVML